MNNSALTTSPIDYQTLGAFRAALRKFLRMSEAIAGNFGLTPQQHQMLLVVRGFLGKDEPAVGILARRLQIRHNSAVGLINRLVKLRLVRRISDKQDRRLVKVVLTAKGLKVLDKLTLAHQTELAQIGPEIRKLLTTLQY
ncbi:MAG: MarR family winged helix-turn-helix transcriptional regulator [Gammaproteobacteria bacterium]